MSQYAETQADKVAEGIHSIQETVKEKLGQTREAVAGYYEEGVEQVKKFESTLEDYIKDKPLRSLLITAGVSLGAGFLIAALIRR